MVLPITGAPVLQTAAKRDPLRNRPQAVKRRRTPGDRAAVEKGGNK
jgi:hypothetical protein